MMAYTPARLLDLTSWMVSCRTIRPMAGTSTRWFYVDKLAEGIADAAAFAPNPHRAAVDFKSNEYATHGGSLYERMKRTDAVFPGRSRYVMRLRPCSSGVPRAEESARDMAYNVR